jgi:hypothetical protein
MKRDLFESKIIDEPSLPPHHCSIVIRVILVFILINQIEVSCNHPRPQADTSHLSELLQECYFFIITLGSINTGQPPIPIHIRVKLDRDAISVNMVVSSSL